MEIEINPPLSTESEVRLGIFSLGLLLAIIGWHAIFAPAPAPAARRPAPHPISPAEIEHGDRSKQQVIFTFDGHESSKSADNILAILAKHRAHATFFLTGKFVTSFPDVTRRIVAAGHEVFNHSSTHPYLTALSDDDIIRELGLMDQALLAVAGVSTKPYFRPPYGDRDGRVLAAAYRAGFQSIYWTVDPRDWQETEGMTADQVKTYVLSNVAPGNIYLLHVGTAITAAVLDEVLTTIEARGYKIVPLTEGL